MRERKYRDKAERRQRPAGRGQRGEQVHAEEGTRRAKKQLKHALPRIDTVVHWYIVILTLTLTLPLSLPLPLRRPSRRPGQLMLGRLGGLGR
jgi:hypothetical protein